LKEVRKQIAEANDIEYFVSECQYKGDCLGTCPKCEEEVRYLTQALEHKRLAGKVVSLVGLSVGLMGLPQAACATEEKILAERETVCVGVGEVIVKGRVTDSVGNPLENAHIVEKGTARGTCSDKNGYFMLRVSGLLPLCVSFVGYETKEIWVPKGGGANLRVVLGREVLAIDEIGVNSYFEVTRRSVITGVTTLKTGDIISERRRWFHVDGCVVDENGILLSGVEIYRKRCKKEIHVEYVFHRGLFDFWQKGRKKLWFVKEGYLPQRVKVKKKNAKGLQVVLKREE
jgi:hypothetical protein